MEKVIGIVLKEYTQRTIGGHLAVLKLNTDRAAEYEIQEISFELDLKTKKCVVKNENDEMAKKVVKELEKIGFNNLKLIPKK